MHIELTLLLFSVQIDSMYQQRVHGGDVLLGHNLDTGQKLGGVPYSVIVS